MSLITATPRQTAHRDILCYKLIYTDRSKSYWLGGSAGGRANKEVFDFNTPVMAKGIKQVTNDRGRFCVDRGFFHSYVEPPANSCYKSIEPVTFGADSKNLQRIYVYAVVPKGTEYYINNSEIASDYIIVFSSKLEYYKYKLKSLLGNRNSI
jgi:hypothetical protein